ncbi:MAG: DUF2325 domain-containing protein [Deltaproteobacteria bacterium]|nr:DUF2325 domain-containing protein [Candidatus Tharpella sp.]
MSILIIGADRIKSIKPKLNNLGATKITHWTARNRNVTKMSIPEHVEMVIFFTDFLHHVAARHLKSRVKSMGLSIFYCRRVWSEIIGQVDEYMKQENATKKIK